MQQEFPDVTHCLTHQRPENQASMVGRVCAECKRVLQAKRPRGSVRGYWESQPAAYALDRRPCFVYTLMWDDFRIRSLHAAESIVDPGSPLPVVDRENWRPGVR